MEKKIRVLGLLPSSSDGTSFYRGMGPFSQMREHIDFTLGINGACDWDGMIAHDVIFMQRPYTNYHVANAIRALQLGKKLIIDYDDNLFEIPIDNGCYDNYMRPDVHKNIMFFLNNAHAVMVSTQALKDYFDCLTSNNKIYVVPNALNDSIFKLQPNASVNTGIIWRGSPTHTRDLYCMKDEIIGIGKQATITFFGMNPKFITSHITHIHQEYTTLLSYFDMLNYRYNGVGIVPLHDNEFNRAKSNIAWMEYTYSGCVTVAPDWPEWRKPGVFNYKNAQELKMYATMITNASFEFRNACYKKSVDYINKNLLLSEVNIARLKIILAL